LETLLLLLMLVMMGDIGAIMEEADEVEEDADDGVMGDARNPLVEDEGEEESIPPVDELGALNEDVVVAAAGVGMTGVVVVMGAAETVDGD
jgi:hypothetical protein